MKNQTINNILYNQLHILDVCNSLVSNENERYYFGDINININNLLTNEQLDILLSEIILNEDTTLIAMGLLHSLGITDKVKYVIDNSTVYLNNDIKVILLNVYSELINGIEYEKRTKKEFFKFSMITTKPFSNIKIDFTSIMIISYFQVIYDHFINRFTISNNTGYDQIKSRILNYVYNVYSLLIGFRTINEDNKVTKYYPASPLISLYDMFICGTEYLAEHNLNKNSSKFNFFIKH